MARFCTLFSSSSGNSTYIGTATEGILIDAGVNNKQLVLALESAGLSPDAVKAVFVTHEHSDHTGALRVFASSKALPVYATGGTLSGLSADGILNGKFPYHKLMPGGIDIDGIGVDFFRTSHDAKESCGYTVTLPDRKVGIMTDTGIVTDDMIDALKGCDLVLIESNYDEDMLNFGPYAPSLKARIRSKTGHLSNDDCARTVLRLYENGTRRFILGHLSRENNSPQRAFSCTNSLLKHMGLREGTDYILKVAPVKNDEKFITF